MENDINDILSGFNPEQTEEKFDPIAEINLLANKITQYYGCLEGAGLPEEMIIALISGFQQALMMGYLHE